MSTNFDKDHEPQLCESSETVTCEMQDNNTEDVIMTSQKNYGKSFSSQTLFSNNNQLKSLEKSCSQILRSNNQLECSTKSFNSQMSLFSSQQKSPVKSNSSQSSLINHQSKNPVNSCSELSLSNPLQQQSSTKFIKSPLSQFKSHSKSPKESHKRELFLSPTKSTSDNSLLHLLLREVQEIKKKAAVERQEMNLKLDRIISFHCRLSRFLLPNEKHIRPENMPSYPLKNDEEMELSEEYLKNNENFRNLVYYFTQLKVKAKEEFKIKDCEVLYAVMAAAITNSLACKYNFRGDGNQKRPFCKLILWEVIIGAIHDKRPNVSIADLSLYAGQWLKNAPYRKQEDGSYGRRDKKPKETDQHLSS